MYSWQKGTFSSILRQDRGKSASFSKFYNTSGKQHYLLQTDYCTLWIKLQLRLPIINDATGCNQVLENKHQNCLKHYK